MVQPWAVLKLTSATANNTAKRLLMLGIFGPREAGTGHTPDRVGRVNRKIYHLLLAMRVTEGLSDTTDSHPMQPRGHGSDC